jgi:hypothetical protein
VAARALLRTAGLTAGRVHTVVATTGLLTTGLTATGLRATGLLTTARDLLCRQRHREPPVSFANLRRHCNRLFAWKSRMFA